MRIRNKVIGETKRVRHILLLPNNTVFQTINTVYTPYRSEMVDTVGRFDYVNYCNHVVTRNLGGCGDFVVLTGAGDPFFKHEAWFTDSAAVYSVPSVSIPGGLDGFIKRGLESIKPKLKSDVSLPNFLLELKDLKRLFSSITTGIAWSRGWTRRSRSGRRRRTDGADVASDIHLSANFGINPLVSDLVALANSLQSFETSLKNFRENASKPLVSYYAENIPPPPPSEVEVGVSAHWAHNERSSRSEAKITLTLRYSYVPLVPMPSRSIRNFARYLGFRGSNTALTVWNAIPFSFVVDWVLKVGNYLKQFDQGLVPVRMDITAACTSVKYQTHHYQWLVGRAPYRLSPTPYRVVTQNHYSRGAVSPEWINVLLSSPIPPETDKLSVKEITLAIALGNKLR